MKIYHSTYIQDMLLLLLITIILLLLLVLIQFSSLLCAASTAERPITDAAQTKMFNNKDTVRTA
jgi:hypothetical protein